MIKQAIIPLAGLGTRLLPLTSVFAKELLPINGNLELNISLMNVSKQVLEKLFLLYLIKKK